MGIPCARSELLSTITKNENTLADVFGGVFLYDSGCHLAKTGTRKFIAWVDTTELKGHPKWPEILRSVPITCENIFSSHMSHATERNICWTHTHTSTLRKWDQRNRNHTDWRVTQRLMSIVFRRVLAKPCAVTCIQMCVCVFVCVYINQYVRTISCAFLVFSGSRHRSISKSNSNSTFCLFVLKTILIYVPYWSECNNICKTRSYYSHTHYPWQECV